MSTQIDTFAALQLPAPLLSALAEVGYETPSPIQAACIPILLDGQDLLGEAQTGTGKTAAFALPVLARLKLDQAAPQALILAPTRELAIQVAEAIAKYARHMKGFHVLPIYGGQSMVIQLRQLSRGPQVIVGTPGRVMDHIKRGSLKLDQLTMLVLDEADEMLRMGFIDDVEWILEHTPAERQTALFSATMPEAIRRVAHAHLNKPQEVKIRTATATVSAIRQRYWQVRGADKLDALTRILEVEEDFDSAIVFVRTKTATVEVADRLEARGYAAAALNGDLTQGLRERVIDQLKKGQIDIVVATDVAARGIDVPRISHVINYDIPYDTEAYVHRIGRTGRAGRDGVAILFVSPREMRMLRAIERATRQPIEQIALPSREAVAGRRVALFKEQILEALKTEELGFFLDIVNSLEKDEGYSAHEIGAAMAWIAQRDKPLRIDEESPYSAPSPYAREPREDRDSRDGRDERPTRPREFGSSGLTRYRIAVGRRDGISPREIVGALANEGGFAGRAIGQINLFDDYSTVELPAEFSPSQKASLAKIRVGGRLLEIAADGDGPPTQGSPRDRGALAPKKRFGKPGGGFPERNGPRPGGPAKRFRRDA